MSWWWNRWCSYRGIGHIGATAIGPSGISLLPLIAHQKYLGYIIGLLSAYLVALFSHTSSVRLKK